MIVNIVLILSFLVALNFLLLIFSCNKTSRKTDNRVPHFAKSEPKAIIAKTKPAITANQLPSNQLAPTGS